MVNAKQAKYIMFTIYMLRLLYWCADLRVHLVLDECIAVLSDGQQTTAELWAWWPAGYCWALRTDTL